MSDSSDDEGGEESRDGGTSVDVAVVDEETAFHTASALGSIGTCTLASLKNPLSETESARVKAALAVRGEAPVLDMPNAGCAGSKITINGRNFSSLHDRGWLTDEVVNTVMRLLCLRSSESASNSTRGPCYFFSSFFVFNPNFPNFFSHLISLYKIYHFL